MKKITLNDAHDEDADIAQLFTSQSVKIPAELRTSIFEQAELHCAEELNSPKNNTRNSSYSSNPWARGFAIAATLSMVAIIIPMLMNEPEPTMDSLTIQAETVAEDTNAMTDKPVVTMKSRDIGATAAAAEGMKSFTAERSAAPLSITSTSPLTDQSDSETAPSLLYRASPDKWINEIKVLIANGDGQKAREEYRLFKHQHPMQANDFNPDFERSAIVDPMPEDDGDPQ